MTDAEPFLTGTLTFLLTDVERSTELWQRYRGRMTASLKRHDEIIETHVHANGGLVVRPRGEGDSRFAVFRSAIEAVAAASEIQQALHVEAWAIPEPIRVRMALHTGDADWDNGDYYGPEVNRCARLRAIAHGGQTILSSVTAGLVRDALPNNTELRDLGTHHLKDFASTERVFQLSHLAHHVDFPPLNAPRASRHNLPNHVSSFIGRDREARQIERRVSAHRLVVLTGPGGVGKTRLALYVAGNLVDNFRDGVTFLDLTPVTDASLVPTALANVMGLDHARSGSTASTLVNALSDKQALLVLDNCEHLASACAELASRLLAGCPDLRVLATSRERLGISGGVTWSVPPLELPAQHRRVTARALMTKDGTRLFVERAREADRHFVPNTRNAEAIARLCGRLDGLPLAIELAAARVRILSAEQILERVDHSLNLLTDGGSSSTPRQRTLRATIDWSYQLLEEDERRLFSRLSVFVGGFGLDALEPVCASDDLVGKDLFDLLTLLADKSLVSSETREDGTTRYRLLASIQEYARECLAAEQATQIVQQQHAEYFLRLAEAASKNLRGKNQRTSLVVLTREHDNIRAALDWCRTSGHIELGLDLAAATRSFWHTIGNLNEGRRILSDFLNQTGGSHTARARATCGAAALAIAQDDLAHAEILNEQALNLYRGLGDQRGIAEALHLMAFVARRRDTLDRARELYQEALRIGRDLNDIRLVSSILADVGALDSDMGDVVAASRLLREAARLMEEIGADDALGYVFSRLAGNARKQGECEDACRLADQAIGLFRGLGHKIGLCLALLQFGGALADCGEHRRARARLEEALALSREIGAQNWTALAFQQLGAVSLAEGDFALTREFTRQSMEVLRRAGDNAALSVSLSLLGQAERGLGDVVSARALFAECVACLRNVHDVHHLPAPIEAAAALIAESTDPLAAGQLYGFAAGLRKRLNLRFNATGERMYLRDVDSARLAAGTASFNRAWGDGATMDRDAALSMAMALLRPETSKPG